MTHEPGHRALEILDALPGTERRLIEALCVYELFDRPVIGYTARALALDIPPERITARPFVRPDDLSGVDPADEDRYTLHRSLRSALNDRLRERFPDRLDRAHRLAAAYYHQPLEPLRTDRLDRYVHELRHLAAVRPEAAVSRLASFAHTALLAGHAEAAGRAATTAVTALARPTPGAGLVAESVKAVARILSSPDDADHHTVMALDRLLADHPLPRDRAAQRIVMFAADLVAYHTERHTPAPSLTAAVLPAAVTTVDPMGLPAGRGWDEFRMDRELREIAATITSRTHRVAFPDKRTAQHEVSTKLSAVLDDPLGAPRRPVIVDLVPWDDDRFLDDLRLRDRNGRPVNMMTSTDVKTHVGREVHRLVTSDGEPDTETGGALVRSLHALAWSSDTDEITAVLRRAADRGTGLGDALRQRIGRLIRYMPVVALVDTHPGMSSEVVYDYGDTCAVRRTAWGMVVVSTDIPVPREVRQNRLQVVTPEGMEPAGPPRTPQPAEIAPLHAPDAVGGIREYAVSLAGDGESGDPLTGIRVDIPFVVPRAPYSRALITGTVCTLIALASGLLSFWVDPSAWAQIISIVAAGGLGADSLVKGRGGAGGVSDLRTHAERPLHRVTYSTVVLAIGAALSAGLGDNVGRAVALAAALVCLALSGAVLLRALRRSAFRPEGSHRALARHD
ncbi:hypothetical protein AB0D99_19575 [Streptomyces sp. NPDC047971]|uniref:hypothetical protein n=1 Tax=Streptomyces sp. NPDC047971 TaxID=3154499 RepID=UPI0034119597